MKYLVTGGCGFIGSHVCDALLAAGHEVRVLDDLSTGKLSNLAPGVELIRGDIVDSQLVEEAMQGMDGCFHLAAVASVERSVTDWVGTHKINQQGSVNVFNAARHSRTPVVYASSAAVYGDNASMPLCEAASARPISAYGADKYGSELHARVAWLSHGIPSMGMRFFNVYGPRQDPASPYSGVISIFANKVLQKQQLTVFGDGSQTRDFIYVADVVNYLLNAMQRAVSGAQVMNVCTGQSTSISQLAGVLSMLAGVRPDIEYRPARAGDIAASLGDPRLAQQLLDTKAQTSLGAGLKATLDFMVEETTCAEAS